MDEIDAVIRRNVGHLRRSHLDWVKEGGSAAGGAWSQDAVAEKLGMSRATYQSVERGARGIGVADLLALAYVFDVSPLTLLTPQPGTPSSVIVATRSASDPVVLSSPNLSRFLSWMRAERPLAGQNLRFFNNHAVHRHNAVRADARATGTYVDGPLPATEAMEAPERIAARRALDALFDAIDQDDEEAVEQHWDMLDFQARIAALRAQGDPEPETSVYEHLRDWTKS